MFVDINFQLRHGLKCMSEYAHIVDMLLKSV